jgi:S-adenosylmethionine-diacylgycerolhomoserine-N-methlytransferase
MGIINDFKVLYRVNFQSIRGNTLAERLESFYGPQAALYDGFREKFLHGRKEMVTQLRLDDGAVWIDLGSGTGSNLEYVAERIPHLKKVYLVDLTESLLKVARARLNLLQWTNVEVICDDVTKWRLGNEVADVVTFSYSLTMIPDWFEAVRRAEEMLTPAGQLGAVDFYVSRKHPDSGHKLHGRLLRAWWKYFFARDNVFLNEDHLPFLERSFETVSLAEERKAIPYIPFPKVPYYRFIGRKKIAGPGGLTLI